MISKHNRFNRRNHVRYVYRKGQFIRSKYWSLNYISKPVDKSYKLAVVVSKKVSKRAVVRNRIRRRLFESVRQSHQVIPPGVEVIITVYDESVANMPQAELDKLLGVSVDRIRLQ